MKKQKALFLDRDGIINIDNGYVYKIEDFIFIEGIFELVESFYEKNFKIFIVTNQSGIGRKFYTINDLEKLNIWLIKAFKKRDIIIEGIEYCPHLPTDNCTCRKPKVGMIDTILKKYPIDLENSFLIGDKQSDIDLALNSNIGFSIAIGNKEIKRSNFSFDSILEAKAYIKKFK